MNKLGLSNLKIGSRLGLAFGALILLMPGIVAVALVRMANVQEATRILIEDDWVKAAAASRIDTLTRANAQRTMEAILADDDAQRGAAKALIASNRRHVDEALEVLDRKIYVKEAREMLGRIRVL